MNILEKITSGSKLFLAPLAGFTDSPFRSIAVKHGAGLTMTELISTEGLIRKGAKTLELLYFTQNEKPLGIQLFGKHKEHMAQAAAIAEEFGPDFIDINLGCPARKVCKSGSGAALLQDPQKIYDIASCVKKSITVPLTAKIRIGWDDYSKNYLEVLKAVEDAGVDILFVHGRTKAQAYSGLADWDIITEINNAANIPVVGNGDITSYSEAMERINQSGCPAVMIGRGAIGYPWVFSGHVPDNNEIYQQVKEHLDVMIDHYGDKGIILMRKHIVKYIHGIRDASKIRKKIVLADSRKLVLDLLKQILH